MLEKFKNNPKLLNLLHNIDSSLENILAEKDQINIMEICGTHTVSLLKHGFRNYFTDRINFLSGPGCPVCVTSQYDIDKVINLAQQNVHLAIFGDMMNVPGTNSSLEKEIAKGAKVDIVYNPLECLKLARESKEEIVFIAVGFETTIPVIASLVQDAKESNLQNLSIFTLVKTLPNILDFLLNNLELNLDGFICPGHVSVIIGEQPYKIITDEHNIPVVIAGFEPVDLALGIESLVSQIKNNHPRVENRYKRMVKKAGNVKAQNLINAVFKESEVEWRGFGAVPKTGLKLRADYKKFDADLKFDIKPAESKKIEGCICDEIITGKKKPIDCSLFRTACTPDNPIGPCMVSMEGACSAYFKYGK